MSTHLLEAWRVIAANKLYHLADDVNFTLDPTFYPENNTTLGGDWPEPGIFLTASPEHWLNGYGYWRPWVVEFEGAEGKSYGREVFVPASNFSRMRISRVMALDAYAREEYGEWGWTEEYFETTYDTFEPISPESLLDHSTWAGFRAPDVRNSDFGWRSKYAQRVKEFGAQRGSIF